ncbi:hypothetical protein OD350_29190 (plasmid) [Clostridium beijerinckii]|uniref:hypothetical protein n=1 Tax=Clostridium beijerinckii TaxID=1520 RepID=UPI0022278E44|nr:hypothetical protein [Clostridium beijerinckii]UYZ38965.1 hypothetical protein OD350_29190 [Clostridium beijerinckii]
MKEIDRCLLNKVHIFLAECYEAGKIIPPETIIEMFGKIFQRDSSCLKHCPEEFQDTLRLLIKDIYDNPSDDFKKSLKVLLTSYYDTIRYEKIKELEVDKYQKDKFWFKALLSEFVLQNLLYKNTDNNALKKFQEEYNQLGSLLGRYYNENDESKSIVIKNMLKVKIEDIFKRYNYKYDLPSLCA